MTHNKICALQIFALACVAVAAAAPQSIQQRQVVPGPAPLVHGEQGAAAGVNPEQAKDLETAGSIGYGYYGGGYPYGGGYSSSLYYGGYPSFGGYGGYGGDFPYQNFLIDYH